MNHDPKGQGASPVLVKPLRRLRAFRVPENYVYDQILGYQLNEDKFNIYRIRPGTIPLDAKLVWIQFDPTKHDAYVVLQHDSFEEYKPGTLCPEIPIELEEVSVMKEYFKGKEMWQWEGSNPERGWPNRIVEMEGYIRRIKSLVTGVAIELSLDGLATLAREVGGLCEIALGEKPALPPELEFAMFYDPTWKHPAVKVQVPKVERAFGRDHLPDFYATGGIVPVTHRGWCECHKTRPERAYVGLLEFTNDRRTSMISGSDSADIEAMFDDYIWWRFGNTNPTKETPEVEKKIIPMDTAEWQVTSLYRPDPAYFGAIEFTDDHRNIFFSLMHSDDRTALENYNYWWRYYEPDRLKALAARDAAKTTLPADGYQRGWRH